jgi:hypothetical protein
VAAGDFFYLNFAQFAFKVIIKLFLCTSLKMFTDLPDFTESRWWSQAHIRVVEKYFESHKCCHERVS